MRVEGLLPVGVTQGCCSSWLALERSRGSICSSSRIKHSTAQHSMLVLMLAHALFLQAQSVLRRAKGGLCNSATAHRNNKAARLAMLT